MESVQVKLMYPLLIKKQIIDYRPWNGFALFSHSVSSKFLIWSATRTGQFDVHFSDGIVGTKGQKLGILPLLSSNIKDPTSIIKPSIISRALTNLIVQ